jgi:hypothetical protein
MLKPCPFCGQVPLVSNMKKYIVPLQDWHSPWEAERYPARIHCKHCDVTMYAEALRVNENMTPNEAMALARQRVAEKWNREL